MSSSITGQTQTLLFEKWWGVNDGCQIDYADELPNGDYILIGGRKSTLFPPGQGYFAQYVCRTDKKGNILWEKEIGFPYAHDYGGSIVKTSWGTYMLVGSTEGDSLPGYRNISVRNIDADGNVIFERYFTSGFFNDGGNVIETSDSCFVFLCKLGIPSTFNQATGMIKIDRYGNEVWRHRRDTLQGFFYQIQQTTDNGYIALGSGAAFGNCFYAKFNPLGVMQWIVYPFGLTDTIPNYPNAIRANADSSFDICYGTNYVITGNTTAWLLFKHYNQNGNCLSTSINTQGIAAFFVMSNNNIWGKGFSDLYIMGDDSIFNKIVGLENDWDSLHKGFFNFIKTADGGYLGVGGYTYDNVNVLSQFYIAKFGDGRYTPQEFSESINAYPNPSSDGNITLTFDILTDENVDVKIYTSEGRLIYSSSIYCPANTHTEKPINLNDLSTAGGMYILEAQTSKDVIRKKLIVRGQ